MSRTVNLFSSLVGWHQISRYFRDSCSVKILLTFNFLFITFFTTTAQDSNLINTKKDTSDNVEYPNKKEFRESLFNRYGRKKQIQRKNFFKSH